MSKEKELQQFHLKIRISDQDLADLGSLNYHIQAIIKCRVEIYLSELIGKKCRDCAMGIDND